MKPTLNPLAKAVGGVVKVIKPRTTLPARKSTLYSTHLNLLSSSPVILFLRPTDFSAAEWAKLRTSLQRITSSASSASSSSSKREQDRIKLTFLRAGLLPALLKTTTLSTKFDSTMLSTHLSGPLTVLTSTSLHPPTLSALLTLLAATSATPSPNAAPVDPKSKLPPVLVERLALLSSSIDGRTFTPAGTKEVGKLPDIDVLRAQIIGLIGGNARNIVSILGASSRQVSRTLEGYAEGLKPKDEPAVTEAATVVAEAV